jgi:hypothetical protein
MDIVFVVRCVGSGLYDKLITRSEESYWVYVCVCVCVRARVCLIVYMILDSHAGHARGELLCNRKVRAKKHYFLSFKFRIFAAARTYNTYARCGV